MYHWRYDNMFDISAQYYQKKITSLVDVSFHIVGLHVRAVSVFGTKSDAVCGFWRISLQFCGSKTPLTPPLTSPFSSSIKQHLKVLQPRGRVSSPSSFATF